METDRKVTRPKIANNEYYMRRTLQLARKGIGMTSPNPMVGAVIVKDGQIIARGYHKRYGDKHAELNAIENAGRSGIGTSSIRYTVPGTLMP